MEVLDPRKYLLKELAGLLVLQAFLFDYVVEELPSTGVLHYQEQLATRFYYLVQLYHIGVTNNFQNMNFSCNPFDI